jgi:hypothetical protein
MMVDGTNSNMEYDDLIIDKYTEITSYFDHT